jgi:hypothetical protein
MADTTETAMAEVPTEKAEGEEDDVFDDDDEGVEELGTSDSANASCLYFFTAVSFYNTPPSPTPPLLLFLLLADAALLRAVRRARNQRALHELDCDACMPGSLLISSFLTSPFSHTHSLHKRLITL